MIVWVILTVIFFVAAALLFLQLRKKAADYQTLEQQDKRDWTLKVALEKTFNLPTIEAKELEAIEPQLDQMMNASMPDEELEEKMRLAVMSLYADKVERNKPKDAPKKDAGSAGHSSPITGRGK
jgi:hypothetical protein